jgi:hypothetical protein
MVPATCSAVVGFDMPIPTFALLLTKRPTEFENEPAPITCKAPVALDVLMPMLLSESRLVTDAGTGATLGNIVTLRE